MTDAASGTEEFVLPSELEVLDRVDRETLRFCELAGFDDATAGMIAMAAIEAVTNAVVHGNRLSGDKRVSLRYDWSPGRIDIRVHDQGGGFDLACVLDPTDPERCMASSGRGIYIMRQIMDSVDFDISKERGTTVSMVKSV
jgi:serine/threonine-protein kinase RsbW